MESRRHEPYGHHFGNQPVGWPAINRPPQQAELGMESPSSSGAALGFHSGRPDLTPMIRPEGSLLRTPTANAPRGLQPLLPRPFPVHKAASGPKPCLVCGKSSCALVSHRHFADKNLGRERRKSQTTPTKPKGPVRFGMVTQPTPSSSSEQFVQYPIVMDSERHELLSLWSREWCRITRGPERHLFPVRWIERVLHTAKAHAALFQALLATSGAMCEMAGGALSDVATRHLQLADQILTQTCTSAAAASRDECLLAALLLTSVYQARGNHQETDRRFSSIVRLVVERGGPHYLGISGAVADQALYIDYLQAVLLDCEPVWKLPLPALDMGIPPRLGAAFRGLVDSNTFNVDLLLAADSICRATDIFEQLPDARSAQAVNAFGYLATIAEYQLAHCNAVLHGSRTWDECICLALLLFNYVVLRNEGAITVPIRKIEHQFWRTVDETITRVGLREVPPCLLLWLLMTGLSSNILVDCEYRARAVKQMRAAKISAAVSEWHHCQQRVLDDFVWMRAAQGTVFREVWLEVEGYKPMS